jgi:hypothetical protein
MKRAGPCWRSRPGARSAPTPLTENPATGVVGHVLNPTVIFGHSTGSQDRTIRARRVFGGTAWRLPEIHVFCVALIFPASHLRVAISGNSNREQILGKRNPLVAFNPIGEFAFPLHVPNREAATSWGNQRP